MSSYTWRHDHFWQGLLRVNPRIRPEDFGNRGESAITYGKIPVAIPRFLLRKTKKKQKQKTPSFDSPWFGLSLLLALFIPHCWQLCYSWFTAISEMFGNWPEEGPPIFVMSKPLVFSTRLLLMLLLLVSNGRKYKGKFDIDIVFQTLIVFRVRPGIHARNKPRHLLLLFLCKESPYFSSSMILLRRPSFALDIICFEVISCLGRA